MYVLVHHAIRDPARFWAAAQEATPNLPEGLALHQSIAATDGRRATCVWEAESVDRLRAFLEPLTGDSSVNDYSQAVNREGVALPPMISA